MCQDTKIRNGDDFVMVIQRNSYLNKLISRKQNGLINLPLYCITMSQLLHSKKYKIQNSE